MAARATRDAARLICYRAYHVSSRRYCQPALLLPPFTCLLPPRDAAMPIVAAYMNIYNIYALIYYAFRRLDTTSASATRR